MSTCFFCNSKIELIPDGKIRYCKCKLLGVDCGKGYNNNPYTRYIGSKPVEEMTKDDIDYMNRLKLKLTQPMYFKLI
jgi:hypothetical protein